MNKKLIVFDWNGTLLADTRASWLAGNECLKFYRADPINLQRYREAFTFPIIHFYKKLGLSVDTILEKKDEANAVFQAAYEALAKNARTRRGSRNALQWIKEQGLGCIILSNYQTDKIRQHLNRLGLEDYFDHVCAYDCGGTTVLQHTTKVDRLRDYMTRKGYSAKDTIIIGDSLEEPEIARLLNLTSIGITDGYVSAARLRAAKPDFVIHNLQALIDILKETS